MRVLLADDEPLALQRLQLAAARTPGVELVGCAANGRQAIAMIRERAPDLAVLDIKMPGQDGLAVAQALRPEGPLPEIIFVTAFHEYAVRAFELQALDYLLKPVSFERFAQAVERARQRLGARTAQARYDELQALFAALQQARPRAAGSYEHSLWVRVRDDLVQVALDSVDYISAEGDYVLLHRPGSPLLHKDTIASLQERLDPARFLRIHRSTIVNLSRVQSLRRRGPRALELVLAPHTVLAVGPSHVESVLETLQAQRFRVSART
ncbi:LytR/AlgR family response regulator transcription factor [Tahibacter harae]|uniref:Response regulator transcription factor n=1 Tax=Tahibacter harae TaxID=2963937 RepID=A0ABT1QTB8_9GAMM|nr:response regulator transcription factor [Tahibacter harae]MCQ4165538.1 response regulator transcription factor [Tahibacter harae]